MKKTIKGRENGKVTVLIYAITWIVFSLVLGLNPTNRLAWVVDFIVIFIFAMVLIHTYNRFRFSLMSYTLIFIFIMFSLIGVHYGFQNVPLDFLKPLFNFTRNPYDRFVHFLTGILLVIPFRELLAKTSKLKSGFWSYFLPITFILGISAFYEILEWLVAINLVEGSSLIYIGAQGEIWDPQKDILMAGIGSTCSMAFILIKNLIKHKNRNSSNKTNNTLKK